MATMTMMPISGFLDRRSRLRRRGSLPDLSNNRRFGGVPNHEPASQKKGG
jgi:hypothetical protein